MKILKTQMSMSRVTAQYQEAVKMALDVEGIDKYEYVLRPFNLVLSKVAGYMPEVERTEAIDQEVVALFIDSDYIFIAIGILEFEKILITHLENESK